MDIVEFKGEYAFLSNFYRSPVEYDGLVYASAEHAFQAAKSVRDFDRVWIASADTPTQAKRRGRTIELRDDWEDVRLEIMEEILRAKFAPGSDLAEKLIATGECELIEGNWWGDDFWGVHFSSKEGQNHLGRLLMKIREGLFEDGR